MTEVSNVDIAEGFIESAYDFATSGHLDEWVAIATCMVHNEPNHTPAPQILGIALALRNVQGIKDDPPAGFPVLAAEHAVAHRFSMLTVYERRVVDLLAEVLPVSLQIHMPA